MHFSKRKDSVGDLEGGGGGSDIFEAIGVTNPGPGTGVQIILIKVQQCTVVQTL
jgi:hypothetical protein